MTLNANTIASRAMQSWHLWRHGLPLIVLFFVPKVITAADYAYHIPFSIDATTSSPSPSLLETEENGSNGTETIENLPNNAPLFPCGSAGGVEEGQYFDVVTQYMDPVCEEVQGYCRLKRNMNYTAILRVIPKVQVETINVKITVVQLGGWETSFWPEYSACGRFNITCPMEKDVKMYGHNEDEVPDKAPPTRGLFRLRFMGTSNEDSTKKPYLCRQIKLQLY